MYLLLLFRVRGGLFTHYYVYNVALENDGTQYFLMRHGDLLLLTRFARHFSSFSFRTSFPVCKSPNQWGFFFRRELHF